jgi:uncharacterized protein YpbB
MADYLPLTEKDLLKISGFGEIKIQKYGSQFLRIISKYAAENNLQSAMAEKAEEKQKVKKEKGDSHRLTFEMYSEGKSIAEIAQERHLAESTIGTHLAVYINSGQLDVNTFVSAEKREKALNLIKTAENIGSVSELLAEVMDKAETTIFLAWRRNQK